MIAILAAILFPVFAKAREKARQASCLSNLRQIGVACLSYLQDYDEVFPPSYIASSPRYSFICQIQPYVKSAQVFDCPSQDLKCTVAYNGERSYGMNDYMFTTTGVSVSAFQSPAETLMVADITPNVYYGAWYLQRPTRLANGYRPDDIGGGTYKIWGDVAATTPWRYCNFCARHNGIGNVNFADGHTKAMTYSTIYANHTDWWFDTN